MWTGKKEELKRGESEIRIGRIKKIKERNWRDKKKGGRVEAAIFPRFLTRGDLSVLYLFPMIYRPDKGDKNRTRCSIPTAFAATNYRMLQDPRNTEICDLTAKSTRAPGSPSESLGTIDTFTMFYDRYPKCRSRQLATRSPNVGL